MATVTAHVDTTRSERIKERIFQNIPEISIERAVYITESYRNHEAEPIVLKSAYALDHILSNISVRIFPDELIIGSQTELSRGAPLFPEYTWKWIYEELDDFESRPVDKFRVSESHKKELRQILHYWKGKTVTERIDAAMSRFDDISDALEAGILICRRGRSGTGHIIPHYERVLTEGLEGIARRTEERIGRLDYANPDDEEKLFFLEAVKIVSEAVIKFSKRYSERARQLAEEEENPDRKKELQAVSVICERVPAQPARTFWEAVQALWITHLAVQLESHGHSISLGRLDRYLFPFYRSDIEKGAITVEFAQQLLDCLWLKFNEIIKVRPKDHAKVHAGYPVYQGVTLGGQDAGGNDDTNELSSMCLESTMRVLLPQPTLMIRVHAHTPRGFLLKSHEVSTLGLGIPIFTNDDIAVAAMLARGIPLEDARRYGLVGCWEMQPEGKSETAPYGGYVNIAKCLEVVLYNGRDPMTGKKFGRPSKEIRTYEDLEAALEVQMKKAVKQLAIINNMGDVILKDVAPLPYLSALVDGCIEKGMPLIKGGAEYNFTSLHAPGIATVADSLAALKRFVFEERAISLEELRGALESDFNGKEALRQMLANKAPKYGNDDDYVDCIAKRLAELFCREVEKYPNARGGMCWPGLWGSENSIPMGFKVGATPDGRKAGKPLADGNSPSQGRDIHGPTAVIRSAAKIDHVLGGADGTQLNMKLSRYAFNGRNALNHLLSLTQTYFELNGESVCYFIINSDVLREAQKKPDEYKGLVVRVAGYSAFFSELSREIQDDLIARTEHTL
jgi:pyruvate formate-lyase/glycerol dehydratase family glycyl radical enzyme